MRILILSWRDLAHPRAGGSEVYSQQLAHHWAAAGHEVTYFAAAVERAPAEEVVDGYRLVRRGNALGVYREARLFYRGECRGRTDWVLDVVNTRPFLAPRWVDDAPVTALVHQVCREVWRYEAPLPIALLGRYWLEPRWLRAYRDTPVLTVSESSRRSLEAYGLRRVAVVPEGVEVPPASQPKEPVPTLLWVGRLSPNKRPDHAIAAFRRVRESVPEARLWVVGAGPMEDRLRRQAPEGVVICGRVDQAKKFELMARAHLLLATSVREGWGLTVSEAALCGTRTVAYDVDGLRDSVTAAGGVLVEPAPVPLARAALEVLTGASPWSAPTSVAAIGVSDWVDVSARVLSGRADDSSVQRATPQTLILQPASVGSVFGPDRSVSGGSLVSCRSGDGRCVLLSGCQAPIGGPSVVSGRGGSTPGSLRWAWVVPQRNLSRPLRQKLRISSVDRCGWSGC